MKTLKGLVAMAMLVAASACIQEDNTVTWFLDPNGEVTWSILERNIRSDAQNRDERMTEESQFIVAARDGEKFIWTLTIEAVPDNVPEQDTVEVTALLGDKLHVALREGEFVEADGFTINDDRRLAELPGGWFDQREESEPPKVMKLVWRMLERKLREV